MYLLTGRGLFTSGGLSFVYEDRALSPGVGSGRVCANTHSVGGINPEKNSKFARMHPLHGNL